MAATVGSATTMKATPAVECAVATMESAPAVERVASMGVAVEPAAAVKALPTMESFTASKALAAMPAPITAEAITAAPAVAVTIPASTIRAMPAGTVEAMEPWARADENAPGKVIRAVVAVRRARVRVIAIVTIGAGGRRSNVRWAWRHPESDRNLCVSVRGVASAEDQQCRHQSIL
jgi:hypothetical protein